MMWTKNETECLKKKFPISPDSELAGFMRKSPNSLRIKASRMGIRKKSALVRETLELNETEKQVIIGGLLGDLSCRITKTSKNACLEGGHCAKQKEYLLWKVELLQRLAFKVRKTKINTYLYQSRNFRALNKYYDVFYNKGPKIVSKDILDSLNDFGLLIWYLDDGSYNKRDKNSYLHTNGFSYDEQVLIKNWFKEKYELTPRICEVRNHNYPNKIWHNLYFSVKDTRKLFELFEKFEVPECMKYKLGKN